MTELPDFSYMSQMTPEQFEAERDRLITAHLESLPPHQRIKIASFQDRLDAIREELGRDALKTLMAITQLAGAYVPVLTELNAKIERARDEHS